MLLFNWCWAGLVASAGCCWLPKVSGTGSLIRFVELEWSLDFRVGEKITIFRSVKFFSANGTAWARWMNCSSDPDCFPSVCWMKSGKKLLFCRNCKFQCFDFDLNRFNWCCQSFAFRFFVSLLNGLCLDSKPFEKFWRGWNRTVGTAFVFSDCWRGFFTFSNKSVANWKSPVWLFMWGLSGYFAYSVVKCLSGLLILRLDFTGL